MPTDNQNVKLREANELCFVVECVFFAPEQSCLLAAVAWCEAVRPHQGYVSKQKKELPEIRQVERPLQTGSCLTSLWGFGGVQCVPT